MKEQQYRYPIVFLHGFMGWGAEDGLSKVWDYTGFGDINLKKHMLELGYEFYNPSLGPFASAWDRACELWAYLFGGRVDYGKVHAEKYGHERYGRIYEKGALPDLGTDGPHKKINLFGHSFGGPAVKMIAYLWAYGSEEERAGTPADELSPLFEGGHGYMIHTIHTMSGVNNGTILTDFLGEEKTDAVAGAIYTLIGILGNTMAMKVFDFGQQYTGLSEYPENLSWTSFKLPNMGDVRKIVKRINANREDNVFHEMKVDVCQEVNDREQVDPGIYYFAERTIFSHWAKHTNRAIPNKGGYWASHYPSYLTGSMVKPAQKHVHRVKLDHDWYLNDGYVSLPGMSAPFNQPQIEATFDSEFRPGIWYNMPVRYQHDHTAWCSLGANKVDYWTYFEKMCNLNDSLPDGDLVNKE